MTLILNNEARRVVLIHVNGYKILSKNDRDENIIMFDKERMKHGIRISQNEMQRRKCSIGLAIKAFETNTISG